MNDPDMMLEDEQIYLRVVREDDITDEYVNGLNDPEVNRYLVDVRRTRQTKETVRAFVKLNSESETCVLLGVFVRGLECPFTGTVRISGISWYHYNASVGICLFAGCARNRGIGSRALVLAKEYAFGTLGLHYLEAGIYSSNEASLKSFAHAGYTERCRAGDKYRYDDGFAEVVFMGVVNDAFDPALFRAGLCNCGGICRA